MPNLLVTAAPHVRSLPAVDWAIGVIRTAVARSAEAGHDAEQLELILVDEVGGADQTSLPPEAYTLRVENEASAVRTTVTARDSRGFSYAITELAARIGDGGLSTLERETSTEAPAVPIRGIQRAFVSVHEDTSWFHNRRFWTEYLDFLAAQRFNRFHLAFGMGYNYAADPSPADDNYLCFAYPFLVDVPGFDVRAQGVTDDERDRNLAQLAFVAAETARRGMDFQLGLWNHAWDYGRDAQHWYPVLGVSRENHAAYCAAAVGHLLSEIPEISGLSFRVHYEGGIQDEGHEVFWERIFDAIATAGRPIQVDMHAKGVDRALLDAVHKRDITPILSAKYWAEHMGLPYHQAAIREREQNEPTPAGHELTAITEFSRRFTRYGFADFLAEDRDADLMFRVWPGTQRFLLWGDPAIAAGYGRTSTFAGARGVDICEPLYFKGRKGSGRPGGRDLYVREDLRMGDDSWQKYRYTYAVWGRHLYNPDAPAGVTTRVLREDHGEFADAVGAALAPLSRILPLVTTAHGVGASNNGYWPELYVDLPISPWVRAKHYEFDTAKPVTWGGVSPLDPELFCRVNDYVDSRIAGDSSAKYTPLEVAAWLEQFVAAGEAAVAPVRASLASGCPQSVRTLVDIEVLLRLGTFYAGKFRAAVDYAVWERTSDRSALQSAVATVEAAHRSYAGIVPVVEGIYRNDLAFGPERGERGHWRERLADMETDLLALRRELDLAPAGRAAAIRHRKQRTMCEQARLVAPERFQRGEPIEITLDAGNAESARLRYRRVVQSESWSEVEMQPSTGQFVGVIPAKTSESAFPLMFYAIVTLPGEEPILVPGLDSGTLATQPYALIHSDA